MIKITKKTVVIAFFIVFFIVAVFLDFSIKPQSSQKRVQVVAAENFWGSLVSQIGGNKISVKSIINNPKVDPHEYESTSNDAKAVSNASYVIYNGAGYDPWAPQLISANNKTNQKVLDVASYLGVSTGSNPHLWYNPVFVNKVVIKMEQDLVSLDPKDKAYYQANLTKLQNNLKGYQNLINQIALKYKGVKVATTEDVFSYLAQSAKLNLISPTSFITAIAEGNDPSPQSIIQFENQISSHQVKILVYNKQTVTPITIKMRELANQNHIPVIGITELVEPSNQNFQNWMYAEINSILNGLNQNAK